MKKQIFSAWKCTPAIGKPEVRYFVLKMWTWKFSMLFSPPDFIVILSQLSCTVSVHLKCCLGENSLAEKDFSWILSYGHQSLRFQFCFAFIFAPLYRNLRAENLNGEICSFISLFLPRSLLPNTCRWSPLPQIPGPSYIHKEGVKMEGRTVIRKPKYG